MLGRQAANEKALATQDLQKGKYDAALKQIEANNDANISNFTKEAEAAQTKAAQDTLAALKGKAEETKAAQVAAAEKTLDDLRKRAEESIGGIAEKANANAVAAQEKVVEEIKAKSAESVGIISSSAKAAIDALSVALLDGVVKANDSPVITNAINQAKASREGADQRVADALGKLVGTSEVLFRVLPALERRIESLESFAKDFNR